MYVYVGLFVCLLLFVWVRSVFHLFGCCLEQEVKVGINTVTSIILNPIGSPQYNGLFLSEISSQRSCV